jgi:hypothetical protein
VTVTVVVLDPSAVTMPGLAVTLDVLWLGAPATNVTEVVTFTAPSVAVMVLPWATVDANVAVNTPDALVVPLDGVKVLPVPELARLTAWPEMRFPWASFTVTVTVVVLEPSAVTDAGLAVTVEVVLLGAPATNVTDAVLLNAAMVAVTVSLCAVVEANVAVKTPEALVLPLVGVNVLFVPVLPIVTA